MVLSKLQVVEYFDSVTNEIDLITEQAIAAQLEETSGNERVEQLLNERRQVLLSKVNEIQQHCLRQIEQLTMQQDQINNNNKSNESDRDEEEERIKERVFTKYCFAHEYCGLVYLFVVDLYASDREVGRFRTCLKDSWNIGKGAQPLIEMLDPCLRTGRSTRILVDWLEGDELFELDSPIIHVHEPFQLEHMWINGPIEVDRSMSCQALETKLFRGPRKVTIAGDKFSEMCDTLDVLVKHNVPIDELGIRRRVNNRDEFDRLVNLLSIKKLLVTDMSFKFDDTFEDSFWAVPPKVDLTGAHVSLEIRQKQLLLSQLFEWLGYSQLRSLKIECYIREEEKLSRQQLGCLTSLQEFHLESDNLQIDADALCDLPMLRSLKLGIRGHKDKNAWRFLDSVRDRLEKLSVVASETVSSVALRDMPKLKELVISGNSERFLVEIRDDSDEQNFELFAGLGSLEKLTIKMVKREQEEMIYSSRNFQHLPSLQHLDLTCKGNYRLSLFTVQGSSCSPLLPWFSNLRLLKLSIHSLDSLCPKPFSGLSQLTHLVITFSEAQESITQKLLHGLDSLTHLTVGSHNVYYAVDSDAFDHLDKLVEIRLSKTKQTFEELQASGLFDLCKSIKSIEARGGTESPKAVYFDKFDRFVWVKGCW